MRLRSLKFRKLKVDSWDLPLSQTWCILGGNGSGKSLLASLIAGESKPDSGEILDLPPRVGWASFETQQATYEHELENDDTDFLDRIDTGSRGLDILLESGASEDAARRLANKFKIEHLLDQGYKLLSSGEARKFLLLKEILSEPDLLILDEPFEGLDIESRRELNQLCRELIAHDHPVLLLANRLADVADWCTHLALIQRGELICSGERVATLETPELKHLLHFDNDAAPELPPPPSEAETFDPILELRNCRIQYTDTIQFENFDWTLCPRQHTIITGPNGAGKSTLLQLVVGDHPQCYSNDLKIFGVQRGSGESIWDLKKHIGLVSAALHREYRAPGNARTTVISGFYDSIGLYHKATAAEHALAMKWLQIIGLADQANRSFRALSFGQQRLVLIARGLIKQPPLIILDEPTQGLDDLNRHLVLSFLEKLADLKNTTLLFVSHRQDEHLDLFQHRIEFTKNQTGPALYTAICHPQK
ncbi:MAG: ATP-binding cassette domain-containing protein [Verrucomicrobiota bacterium]